MARTFDAFVFILLPLIFHQSSSHEFSSILDNCKNSCERSYPLHTYPKERPLLACKQGCRLSAIEQLRAAKNPKENVTEACITGCQQSFKENDSNFACILGCKSLNVIPSPDSYQEDNLSDRWSFSTYMVYVYPVLDVKRYCQGFMNKVGYYYRISSSYYYSYGDGESILVEVNEQPQEFISVPQYDNVDFVENDEESDENSYSDDNGSSYSSEVVNKGDQWLRCVSERSGLPVWFLTSLLFMSIFSLVWLCCAAATIAPREKKVKASVIRDLMLLDDDNLLEKVPLVKADEQDESGPLPVKVHIDATTL